MRFEFNVSRVEVIDFDPEEFRDMHYAEILAAIRANTPSGVDPYDVQAAADVLYARVGAP